MKISSGKKSWTAASNAAVNREPLLNRARLLNTTKWRLAVRAALVFAPALACAQSFSFEIGPPIAAQDYAVKSAAFVFRATGCSDPSKVEVSGTAEGLVGTDRRSVTLQIKPAAKPGVYAIYKQWERGNWVVVLRGACGGEQAGAIIPVGSRGFVRDASKFYARAPTPAEIDAAIKSIPEGGYK
jgi:hypothetical protein